MSDFFGTTNVQLLRGASLTPVPSAAAALADKKYVLVYFSAHWCPPCRAFTPKLRCFYDKFSKTKNFEVVFVSLDRSAQEMASYMRSSHGDWLAMSFDCAKGLGQQWASVYSVRTIPTLLIFENEAFVPNTVEEASALCQEMGTSPSSLLSGKVSILVGVEEKKAPPASSEDAGGVGAQTILFSRDAAPTKGGATRTLITRSGCGMLYRDPDGDGFPWPQGDAIMRSHHCNLLRNALIMLAVLTAVVYVGVTWLLETMEGS